MKKPKSKMALDAIHAIKRWECRIYYSITDATGKEQHHQAVFTEHTLEALDAQIAMRPIFRVAKVTTLEIVPLYGY